MRYVGASVNNILLYESGPASSIMLFFYYFLKICLEFTVICMQKQQSKQGRNQSNETHTQVPVYLSRLAGSENKKNWKVKQTADNALNET